MRLRVYPKNVRFISPGLSYFLCKGSTSFNVQCHRRQHRLKYRCRESRPGCASGRWATRATSMVNAWKSSWVTSMKIRSTSSHMTSEERFSRTTIHPRSFQRRARRRMCETRSYLRCCKTSGASGMRWYLLTGRLGLGRRQQCLASQSR